MKVLDLFAGCGGFSHGFLQAGYDITAFVEQWEPAIKTFLKNHPNAKLLGKDITKVSNEAIAEYYDKIDVIIGGPPCQGFSLCGKRNPHDKRNKLYKEFLRFVEIVYPKLVIMENVPSLLSMKDEKGEKIIDKIVTDLIKRNYFVSYKILTASEYGVPQERKRLILIGKRMDLFPLPNNKRRTVGEAISNVPRNGHEFFETTKETLERISKLQEGEKLSKNFNFSRQRLFASKPSRTVTTKPMFIHPFEDRFLTPRELARLQSFPDDFEFYGSKTDMVKQIGNAVPPLFAKVIAEKVREVTL